MIDYCIKMPEKEEYGKGHRYPYYSCEVLCSINGFNIEKLLKTQIKNNDNIDKKSDKSNNKKCKKGKEISEISPNNNDKNERESIKKQEVNKNIIDDNEKEEIEEEEEKMDIDDVRTFKESEKEKDIPNITLVYSVFDHLFSFFQDKTSFDNSVLMGYFNKIANYLIKTKTKLILEYMLIKNENIILQLISNINSYSIANIITNMLNALSEDNTPDSNDKYMMIVNKLLEQLNLVENDNNTIEIICELIINCIIYNNKIKLSKIIDVNIINKFEEIIKKYYVNYIQNKNKVLSVVNLLTKMNKSILSNFNNKITSTKNSDDNKNEMMNLIKLADKASNHFTSLSNTRFDFKELVYKSFLNNYMNYCNSINNICIIIINNLIQQQSQKNNEDIGNSYSSKKSHKLGLNKIIEFEFIKTVLDIYINCLGIFGGMNEKKTFIIDKIKFILNTPIFKLLIEYYFQFKNNNFFTNIMIDFIKVIFDNEKAPEELIINFLQLNNQNDKNKDNLITLLMNDLINNTKFTFENSNNNMNSLLFGSNLIILNYIFSSKNPYLNIINEQLPKEKFFYENFIININYIFSKKLYKTDENNEKPEIDALGVRINSLKGIKGDLDIPFSAESLNDLINFYLKVNEKYLAGEEYISLFKERAKRIEEIIKSNEYIRLGNQNKDDSEMEEEEEEDEYGDEDIPKPVFFNSKLDEKKKENDKKEENGKKENEKEKNENEKEENEKKENDKKEEKKEENKKEEDKKEENDKEENDKEEISRENNNDNLNNKNEDIDIENKKYNDVNYWHPDIKNENMEDILKELL